mmetsp:Transcript_57409/g.129438  ORF Transcript_57409/g.129438 Transcript_57409/m.129438 type:complete len:87 (-) Transcript_57409:1343-1603(-)
MAWDHEYPLSVEEMADVPVSIARGTLMSIEHDRQPRRMLPLLSALVHECEQYIVMITMYCSHRVSVLLAQPRGQGIESGMEIWFQG